MSIVYEKKMKAWSFLLVTSPVMWGVLVPPPMADTGEALAPAPLPQAPTFVEAAHG